MTLKKYDLQDSGVSFGEIVGFKGAKISSFDGLSLSVGDSKTKKF